MSNTKDTSVIDLAKYSDQRVRYNTTTTIDIITIIFDWLILIIL